MRMSHMMLKTQRAASGEAELSSHQLVQRAGLARRVAAGIYSLTPLAYRVVRRIEAIVREEMERIGGQELLLPVIQPAELWQESGRYQAIQSELARFNDAGGRAMVLAMTHEEAVTDLARSVISSYRQLPQMVFQIQTKFRDEPRPRGGLVRLREFLMKDGYSFHATDADLDAYYEQVVEAYRRVFARLEVPVLVVEADTGIMGGLASHEFMVLAPGGEDTLIICPSCGYAANQEVAAAHKGIARYGEPEELRELYTPGATTIAALAEAATVTPERTLKAVFYTAGERLMMALIRGDLEVNEIKLRALLGQEVRSLAPDEARARGLVTGYAGPVGLRMRQGEVLLVADDSVVDATNLVAGANRTEYHLAGVCYGRDFAVDLTGDIALAGAGQPCAVCGAALEARRGIEAANTFKLGTKYSATMGATYRDASGGSRPVAMGCYGLGITRMLACVLETHTDRDGILWPESVAPYRYHLVAAGKEPEVREQADALYAALGVDVTLYDDREASAGVKLTDADLLGMPVRVLVSARSLARGGAEVRARRTGEAQVVPLAEVVKLASG